MSVKGKNNPFYGKKHTAEALLKNRLAHLGKKDTEKTRLKRRMSHLGLKHNSTTKEKIRLANTGIKFSEERKKKISIKASLTHKRLAKERPIWYKEKQRKACLVGCVQGGIKAIEKQTQRGFVSKPEKLMKSLLPNDFIHGKGLGNFGVPDFHSPKRKIIIEVDGVYWHSMPKNKLRDKRKDIYYNKMGYKTYRFSDIELNKKLKQSKEKLNLILNK